MRTNFEFQMTLSTLNQPVSESSLEAEKQAACLPVFSFFTGAGFLDSGFEKMGFASVSANEVHQPFLSAFEFSRQSKGNADCQLYNCSIEDFTAGSQRLPRLNNSSAPVGFIGGPPCPDFSIAGKQRGKSGENGRLSGTYARLICEQQPDWFLFENVKGLWRTKKHRAFYDEICKLFIKNGYSLTNKLINSLEYGVPQDRERIILLGFKTKAFKSLSTGFMPEGEYPWAKDVKYDAAEILNLPWPEQTPFGATPLPNRQCPQELTVEHWFKKNKVSEHPNAQDAFTPRAALEKFQTIPEGDDSKKSCKRLHRWRYSPTAAYGNNEVHLHPYQARRISAAEALAIQSLPKEFSLPSEMSLSNMFKTIGNGVPFLAACGIGSSVKSFIDERAR
jgi:DNA (cytosine-5)-methyltransferase 1